MPTSISASLCACIPWEAQGQVASACPEMATSPHQQETKDAQDSMRKREPYFFVSCLLLVDVNAAKQLKFVWFSKCIFMCIVTFNPHLSKIS